MNKRELILLQIANKVEALLIHGLPASRWNGQEFSYPTPDKFEGMITLDHPLDKNPGQPRSPNQAFVVPGDILDDLANLIEELGEEEGKS